MIKSIAPKFYLKFFDHVQSPLEQGLNTLISNMKDDDKIVFKDELKTLESCIKNLSNNNYNDERIINTHDSIKEKTRNRITSTPNKGGLHHLNSNLNIHEHKIHITGHESLREKVIAKEEKAASKIQKVFRQYQGPQNNSQPNSKK